MKFLVPVIFLPIAVSLVPAADSGTAAKDPVVLVDEDAPLQPNDQISIRSLQVKEIADKSYRIDQAGDVNLPLAGIVHVAGEQPREAEKDIGEYALKVLQAP